MKHTSRRTFLKTAAAASAAVAASLQNAPKAHAARAYGISLAGWSLNRSVRNNTHPMIEMPKLARHEFDIEAVELVNTLFGDSDKSYLDRLAKNCADNDVKVLLIMIDGEGNVGSADAAERDDAVKRHSRWIDIAADLGCHSVRMNWAGAPGNAMEDPAVLKALIERSAPAFGRICDYGDSKNLNVIVENHGGPSSYPSAMEQIIAAVDHERFGTLPDFGNFPRKADGSYEFDVYDAIDRLMVHAKAVSAKCYDFDDDTGLETTLDFERIISNVVDKHGYHGYIGIEYEGRRLSEFDGIKACKRLLEKLKA